MDRNTQILEEIVNVLSLSPEHLAHLEQHFDHRLILDVGNVDTIEAHAKQLRLRVEKQELPLVLDYIASKGMVMVTVDHVEDAINLLLGQDRFIEP
jgi:excinuclease UvrABC helicase subunit UvrB